MSPLRRGTSPRTVSGNIRELHTGRTFARTRAKFGKKKADRQAVAIALSQKRKSARRGRAREARHESERGRRR